MLKALLDKPYEAIVTKTFALRRKRIINGKTDAWEGCSEDLRQYRTKLDEIAKWMTNTGTEFIQSRFNPKSGKIELCRFWSCEVVAEIEFCREGGSHCAVVTYPVEYPDIVPDPIRAYVEANLPVKVKSAA